MVALAGGVAGNVKLNQGISKLPGVERVYVQPAMSDAGQPLGAAYAAYARLNAGTIQTPRLEHVYLGGDITAEAAEEALRNRGLKGNRYPDLARRVAHLAATGKIIALCHGRMEYGPRALGNRSIVGSPSDPSINDTLNKRLHRTEFMPFAPVTLAEEARRCYPEDELSRGAFAAEFMTICMDCDPSMKGNQGAVVHVDGTARPQLIRREQNPFYYDVVKAFFDETGIPSMINTSFNMHEEPIVNSADDAVRAWQEGDLDALVLGPFLVER
jgi:carbamoyltransferase